MAIKKTRLDQILVEREFFESREKAQRAVLAGWVKVNGQVAHKASQPVASNAQIEIKQKQKYVSRGGEKLEAALQAFSFDVRGKTAVDLGASTGGFTDCLLQRGAKKVYAVDVGYGQIDTTLRKNPQVILMEKTNARNLTAKDFPEPIDFLTADLSFISLTKVLPAIASILPPGADGVLLIKPQFEAKREEVGKGGVVRDAAIHQRVIETISNEAKNLELEPRGVIPSPLLGPAGNKEFLLWIRKI